MLVTEVENKVVSTTSPAKKVKVNIVASAMNFRAVTQYQHPIHALLRELGQNASDALVRAGKDTTPFTVQLPTDINPSLTVTDEGEGLTPEEFEKYVINVGDSSKRGEEGQTGGFGRGLYAILGYTDSFVMKHRKGGMEWSCLCYIDEDGIPSWEQGEGIPTDEKDGVTVMVPVERKDFWEFTQEAVNVYRWFGHKYSQYKTRPTIQGIEWDEDKYLSEGDSYALLSGYERSSAVVMGNVRYPITLTDKAQDELSEDAVELIRGGIIFFLPLSIERGGKKVSPVTPLPQRDGLYYNANTIQTIQELAEEASSDIVKDTIAEVLACPTQKEARGKYAQTLSRDTLVGRLMRKRKEECIYKGGVDLSVPIKTYKTVEVEEVDALGNKKKAWKEIPIVKLTRYKQRYKGGRGKNQYCSTADPVKDGVSHHWRIYKKDAPITWVQHDVTENGGEVYVLEEVPGGDMDWWLSHYDITPLSMKDSFDEPPRAEKKPPKKTSKELTYNFSARKNSERWVDADVDLEKGGVYVEVFRSSWRNRGDGDRYHHPSLLYRFEAIMGDVPLIGLRKGPSQKILKSKDLQKKWVPLSEYTRKKIKSLLRRGLDDLSYLEYSQYIHRELPISLITEKALSSNSPLGAALIEKRRADEKLTPKKRERALLLKNIFKKLPEEVKEAGGVYPDGKKEGFDKIVKAIDEAYPAIDRITCWPSHLAIQYIRGMDFLAWAKENM